MICPSCHSQIEDDAAFCSHCGAKVEHPAAAAPAHCPACGQPVPEDAVFCAHCGARVHEEAPAPEAAPFDQDDTGAEEAVAAIWGEAAVQSPAPTAPEQVAAASDEAAAAPTTCPSCGASVQPGEAFCPSCGVRLSGSRVIAHTAQPAEGVRQDSPLDRTVVDMARESAIPAAVLRGEGPGDPIPPGSTGPMPRPVSAQPDAAEDQKPKKSAVKIAGIAVGVIAAAAVVGGGIWYVVDQQNRTQIAEQQQTDEIARSVHPVTVAVSAPGWDTTAGSSRLPVHITGTAGDGSQVDEVQYVASDGTGIRLAQGTYQLAVAASPIAADGTIFTVPETAISLTFTSEDTDSAIDATAQGAFALQAIDALDVTDDQIEAAYTYASQDTGDGAANADVLRSAAVQRRDDAAAAAQPETPSDGETGVDPNNPLHVLAASYEFYMPEYWEGRVTVKVDGNNVSVVSKKYPDLELFNVSVQRGATQTTGDIGYACMGDASIGQGHYATVWASRWGWIIGTAYMSNSSDPNDYYSMDEATEIVDLQTGGATSYVDIRDDMVNNGGSSELVFVTDDYLSACIVDSIAPRS